MIKLVEKRDGSKVPFESSKIVKAILAAQANTPQNNDLDIRNLLTGILSDLGDKEWVSVETIQDVVIKNLYTANANVALVYKNYRDKQAKERNRYEKKFVDQKLEFIKNYEKAENAATGSKYDANANVSSKNVATLRGEINKGENIKINRALMYKQITKDFGEEKAKKYIELLENHLLYKHDETAVCTPYCVAISMYPFLVNGLKDLGGESTAPKNIDSFCGEFVNLIFAISSQFAGAVAAPELFLYLDAFLRKEYGEDYPLYEDKIVYLGRGGLTLKEKLYGYFQQIVYSLNQPAAARNYQSVFFNVSYFDRYYFESIFGDLVFPDGSKPKWETLDWLQVTFMKWFNKERTKAELSFPVETMALLIDKETGEYKDSKYKNIVAEELAEGHSFFIYQSDSADSLSSCCFDGNQMTLTKSSNGINYMSFKDLFNSQYEDTKHNFTIFHNGSWVKGKIIRLPKRDMFKITTSNKKEVIVTDNHIFPTLHGDKAAKDITTDDYILFNTRALKGGNTANRLQHLSDLGYEEGYLIGMYLGDGYIYDKNNQYSVTFSINKDKFEKSHHIVEKAVYNICQRQPKYYEGKHNVFTIYCSSSVLVDFIRTFVNGGTASEKDLNLDCLYFGRDFRQGILDGYYLTDGGNSNRIYTTSKKMVGKMECLLTSLGYNSVCDEQDRTNEAVIIRGQKYNRNFPTQCIRFYDSENRRAVKDVYKVFNNGRYFKVQSIVPCEIEDEFVYCFEMENQDEPYFTLPNGMITHNCRLRSSIDKNTFSYSLGAGGVATGSISVMTININRAVQWGVNLEDLVKDVQCFQVSYRHLMDEYLSAGLLPVYDAGFITLDKQYLTIGVNGMVEAAEYLGIEISPNEKYHNFTNGILSLIANLNKEAKKKYGYMFNTEYVPKVCGYETI